MRMRRPAPVLLLTGVLLAALSLTTSAQVADAPPCQQACFEQQSECAEACGKHADPVECEERCQEQLDDCVTGCP